MATPGFSQEEEAAGSAGPTYAGLDRRARAVAAALAGSVPPGERALLLPTRPRIRRRVLRLPVRRVVAVPAYPPDPSSGPAPAAREHPTIAGPASAADHLSPARPPRRGLAASPPAFGASRLARRGRRLEPGRRVADGRVPTEPAATALLQYMSGSTGHPRGGVTHANLLDNLADPRTPAAPAAQTPSPRGLPPFHDMGLIGVLLSRVRRAASR